MSDPHLWVEKFDLTPTHACGPISHAWLKMWVVSVLLDTIFQKYVNYGPCKERKTCVKWMIIPSLQSLIFEVKSTGSKLAFICVIRLGLGLRTFLEDFRILGKTSEFFGNLRKWSCRLQKSQPSQDKNLTHISRKSWQVEHLRTPVPAYSLCFHSTFLSCSQIPVMFYHSVIHGL